jgi:quercetin dioxygenase-like cupin family protein
MAEIDYGKNLVIKPAYVAGGGVKGRQSPVMTYMSNQLVPGCNIYIELGWIYGLPEPNPHIFEHSHDYEEIVLHIGGNPDNLEDLGGEIEYYVGGQPLTFDKTTAIYVPRGVKHGPVIWKKFRKPHIEMSIILGPGSIDEAWASSASKPEGLPQKKDDIDYEKYLVREPIYMDGIRTRVGPKGPATMYMCNDLVPEADLYIDYRWLFEVPEPYIFEHTHDYEEIVMEIGSNPDNPEDLGAEMEFHIGGQPFTFSTTTAIYIPKGIKHGPLTWNRIDRPQIQMPIVIGAGTLSKAGPAGYRGKGGR